MNGAEEWRRNDRRARRARARILNLIRPTTLCTVHYSAHTAVTQPPARRSLEAAPRRRPRPAGRHPWVAARLVRGRVDAPAPGRLGPRAARPSRPQESWVWESFIGKSHGRPIDPGPFQIHSFQTQAVGGAAACKDAAGAASGGTALPLQERASAGCLARPARAAPAQTISVSLSQIAPSDRSERSDGAIARAAELVHGRLAGAARVDGLHRALEQRRSGGGRHAVAAGGRVACIASTGAHVVGAV